MDLVDTGEPLGLSHVRDRAWSVLAKVERGGSEHFVIEQAALSGLATTIAERHGESTPVIANGWWELDETAPDMLERLAARLERATPAERTRTGFDLALLWALDHLSGAKIPDWGAVAGRLLEGAHALDGSSPRVEAGGLQGHDDEAFDRATKRLSAVLLEHRELFGTEGRFGNLFDRISEDTTADTLFSMLSPVSTALFSSGTLIGGKPCGDVWRREGIAANQPHSGLVPFHALGQHLVLDLLEPMLESGIRMTELEQLTAPATRMLCNQLLALGLVRPRHAAITRLAHPPSSDIVVELRCLAVALMDRLADRVRAHLDLPVERLPVIRLLGPVARLAKERIERASPAHASPSIAIASTTF